MKTAASMDGRLDFCIARDGFYFDTTLYNSRGREDAQSARLNLIGEYPEALIADRP